MKIGFGRIDVTPPLGSYFPGGWQLEEVNSIHDPLELNAIALQSAEGTVIIITADFLHMEEKYLLPIRKLLAEKFSLPLENILIQSLHQHTSPPGGDPEFTTAEYCAGLPVKFSDVASVAMNDLAETTMSTGERETPEPLSFIRRFRMKDGSVATNPGTMNPNIDHPLGEADNTVRLVRFHREGKKDIALIAFQTHPDTIAGHAFCADWPGYARRIFEKETDGTHCILMNGCQGDTNHYKVGRPVIKRELQAERYAFTENMGRIIARTAMALWDNTTPLEEGVMTCAVVTKKFLTNTEGVEEEERCKYLWQKICEKDPEGMALSMADRGRVRRIALLDTQPLFQKVPVTLIAFGRLAFVGYGGEPFTEYATVLRKAHPDLFLITCCLCNGAQGYLPSAASFSEGGYEACTSSFNPEAPVVLQGAALELLAAHKKKL